MPDGTGGFTHILLNFGGLNGRTPSAGLTFGSDAAFYGSTVFGGTSGIGTVYSLAPDGSGGFDHSVLYNFTDSDGSDPQAGVILAEDRLMVPAALSIPFCSILTARMDLTRREV